MDEAATSALQAAWVQTGAAVVQAIAAGAALWASYRLAKKSHDDALKREAHLATERRYEQEDAAWTLLYFLKRELSRLAELLVNPNAESIASTGASLKMFIDRAAASPVERLEAPAAWQYFMGVRTAAAAHHIATRPSGFLGLADVKRVRDLCHEMEAFFAAYMATIGRDPLEKLSHGELSAAPAPAAPAAGS